MFCCVLSGYFVLIITRVMRGVVVFAFLLSRSAGVAHLGTKCLNGNCFTAALANSD